MSHNQGRLVRERKPPERFCNQEFLNGHEDQYDRCHGGYKWVGLWGDYNYHQPQAVTWEKKEEELLEKILRDGEKLTSHGYKPDEWLVDDIEEEVEEVEEVEESDEVEEVEESDGEESDGEESDDEESDGEESDDEYKPNDYMQDSSQEDTDEEYTDEEYTDEEYTDEE